MNKIDIESLLINSAAYDKRHTITQTDVLKANDMYRRITATRNEDKPMPGDIMICRVRSVEYLSGHIEYENLSKTASVCVRPSIPFISSFCCRRNEFNLDTSGGYWLSIAKRNLGSVSFVGKRDKLFKSWGHCGACTDGAFTFSCEVNVWDYHSDDIY